MYHTGNGNGSAVGSPRNHCFSNPYRQRHAHWFHGKLLLCPDGNYLSHGVFHSDRNRLVAEKVDKGSLAGFLSTPVTRLRIVLTSTLYLLISLIVMWGLTSLVGLLAAEAFQPGALDRETFLLMNAGAFLYHLAVSSICFCSSCIFNTSRNSLTFGAGLPLLFFVISLLRKLSLDLDFLKYFTLNTLFDTEAILQGADTRQISRFWRACPQCFTRLEFYGLKKRICPYNISAFQEPALRKKALAPDRQIRYTIEVRLGEMSEWSIVRHSKCRALHRAPGSNPGLSAR